jgi:hypothetical protein
VAKDDKNTQQFNVVTEEAAVDKERINNIEMMNAAQVHPTRTQFTKLMLINPNYFGTMPESGEKVVEAMSANTAYEQLRCIGLNSQQDKLEAVLDIKRHNGYNGDACHRGSTEYVRFFVQRGSTWHDIGEATLNVHDLAASALPLSYSVEIDMHELRRICRSQNLVRVRGILSWNWQPTPGNPNFIPPWGNVLEVTVQIATRARYTLKDALDEKLFSIEPELLTNLNQSQELELVQAQPASYSEMKKMYAGTDVPPHRFGLAEAQKAMDQPLTSAMLAQAGKAGKADTASFGPNLQANQLTLNPAISAAELVEIFKLIEAESGNTTFEQLSCVGYNPQTNIMSGVISMKRSSGYSGGLCSPGSTEYVGFWVQYSGSWHWLGNAQVQVHDLTGVDNRHQVEYAVERPVNMPAYPCHNLAGLPLRAILSWNTPPTGPNDIPIWGNVVNTHVQPRIGEGGGDGQDIHLNLERVGGVRVSDIHDSGTSVGRAFVTGGTCNVSDDRPFGGRVDISGYFTNAPDIFHPHTGHLNPGTRPLLYQVSYQKVSGGPVVKLSGGLHTFVTTADGTQPLASDTYFDQPITPPTIPDPQPGIVGPYYTWMGGSAQHVDQDLLAQWYTNGLDEDLYQITVTGYRWNGASYVPTNTLTKLVYIYNGYPHPEPVLGGGTATFLRPQLDLHIGTAANPGDCNDETQGVTITGVYTITDNFFGTRGFTLRPSTIGGVVQPNTVSITSESSSGSHHVATDGPVVINGDWSLDTNIPPHSHMRPCGYTVTLGAYDRAIVNSDPCNWGHYNEFSVGFCLRAPSAAKPAAAGGGGC